MATLGVELILANSPQAKGRVERANGTLQDRLVKEMKLRGVSDIAAANTLLDGKGKGGGGGGFLADLNARFAVPPKRARPDLHRRVTAGCDWTRCCASTRSGRWPGTGACSGVVGCSRWTPGTRGWTCRGRAGG